MWDARDAGVHKTCSSVHGAYNLRVERNEQEQVNERMSIISGGFKCAKTRKCDDVIKGHRESR